MGDQSVAEGRGGDQIKAWVFGRETGMGTSLGVEVRHLVISGYHQTAGTSQTTEAGAREKRNV